MSWAAVAKSATAPAAPSEAPAPSPEDRVAIIDANAIISGLRLEHLADRFCTIPEVVNEVRDKQSRAFLSTLPFSLDVRDPTDESVRAVQRFARETGDIHSLSAVDLKLLALAHSLEVAAHGTDHLREHPVQVRTRQKHRARPRPIPGWGNVANPEDWRVVDEAPEDMMTNVTGGAQSRIIADVQSLTLDEQAPAGVRQPPADAAAAPAATLPSLPLPPQAPKTFGAAAAAAAAAVVEAADPSDGQLPSLPLPATSPQAPQQPPPQPPQPGTAGPGPDGAQEAEHDDDEGDDDEDDDGWQTAAKSRNAARRRQRRERRRQAWQEQQQQHQQVQPQQPQQQQKQQQELHPEASAAAFGGHAASGPSASDRGQAGQPAAGPPQQDGVGREQEAAAAATASQAADAGGSAAAADAPVASDSGKQGGEGDGEGVDGSGGSDEEGDDVEEGEAAEEEEFDGLELVTEEEEGEGEGDGASEAGTTATGLTEATATATIAESEALLQPNTTSNVFSVTADFAMQNVLLQMGLRLVTRDGKQITRVSRWALRCSACFFVTKEAGRLFCPRCGNLTMDKVEVSVGPGGAEFFGVRKKFVLRGTRFSLPKPKSGKGARFNPVLREDVYLARTGGLGGKGGKAASKKATELDPFAPEYGSETWHQTAGGRAGGRGRGPAGGLLITNWKHNPNESKSQRKSRRK